MKRPTDEQLRRRVAKAKGLKNLRLDFSDYIADDAKGKVHPAYWLESLDAACALIRELKGMSSIQSHWADTGLFDYALMDGDGNTAAFIQNETSACRACVLAYLSVMEAKR